MRKQCVPGLSSGGRGLGTRLALALDAFIIGARRRPVQLTVIASDSKMGRSSLLALFLWTLCLVRGQSPSTSVPVPECPPGFEFQECGTACPQTCADLQRPFPRPCTLQCVRGEEYIVMQ